MRPYLTQDAAMRSFISESQDIEVHRWIEPGETSGLNFDSPDVIKMARWAMHYLVCNPQKPLDYECRFAISPLNSPPALGDSQHDEVAIGDTESRNELAFIYMREMSGLQVGKVVEDKIRERLISYLQDDGLCWCSPYACGCGTTEPAAMSWTTSHLLLSSIERYRRSGDSKLLLLAEKMVRGLKSLARWKGAKAYYEGGMAPWSGKWFNECSCYYPMLTGLVKYFEITGDEEVLEFTQAMADGIIAQLQPNLGRSRIKPDGSHCSSNGHLTMRGLVGIAQLGQLTANARYIEFVRRTYEFNRATGTDWGWYPENIFERDRRYYSETCFTAEMTETAVALANSGYTEYWDHIERTVRNYLRESQFFVTPDLRKMYEKVHPDLSRQQVDLAMDLLKKFEGGFLARQTPNDWVYKRDGVLQMSMMGCCPPEGMRSLFIAWANTVIEKGDKVFVNMSLDRDCDACSIKVFVPKLGRVEVKAKKEASFHLRPPSWAEQEKILAFKNNERINIDWAGNYIRFKNAIKGDILRIDYPLPEFTQRVPVGYDGSEDIYHVRWLGNEITGISPEGKYLPIFQQQHKTLPTLTDPEKWELGEIIDTGSKKVLSNSDWKPD